MEYENHGDTSYNCSLNTSLVPGMEDLEIRGRVETIQTPFWSLDGLHSSSRSILFQAIHFCISTQFCSIWPIYRTLSGSTTLGQSEPGSNGNKRGTLHSPKVQHYWNLTIRLFSIISRTLEGGVLLLCRDAVGVFCSPSQMNQIVTNRKII